MARRKVWVPKFTIGASLAASADIADNLLTALPSDLEAIGGLTISRIIGNISIAPLTIAKQAFKMAIMVRHESLVDSEPDLTGEISGNLMWSWFGRTNGGFIETSSGSFTSVEERIYFDVRVQRKLLPNYELALLIQNNAGSTW